MKRKLYPGDHAVDAPTLRLLCLHSLRYALGRQTSAPSFAANAARRFDVLTAEDRAQFADDIDWHERTYGLGAACDTETWTTLRAWLRGGA